MVRKSRTIVTGANLNQLSHHNGGPHIVVIIQIFGMIMGNVMTFPGKIDDISWENHDISG